MREFLRQYVAEEKRLLDEISTEQFERFVEVMLAAYERESQIFVFGNGGSAVTASHFACDINKGVSMGLQKRFKVICLNDSLATMLAYANDVSYEDVFVEQLKNFLRQGDVVIGVSGSGKSRNVIKAVEYANENGAQTMALAGFDGGELAKSAKTVIIVPTDDMQKIEDMHLIVSHAAMQVLCRRLRAAPAAILEVSRKDGRQRVIRAASKIRAT